MRNVAVKSNLSEPRCQLLELMQNLGFGRVETLAVHAGEPVFDPPPTIVREVKFGGENGPRAERRLCDFTLKSQVIELFDEFDRLRDGVIDVLTIKHGLPFNMSLAAGGR